jgi:hypothetical protein
MNLNVLPLVCVVAFGLAAIPFLLFVKRQFSLSVNWRLLVGLSVAMLALGAILAAIAIVAGPSPKNTTGTSSHIEAPAS